MRSRLIIKDLMRNKTVTLAILFFIGIAAMLLSLTSILSVNLFGSIDHLTEEAKTPRDRILVNGTSLAGTLQDNGFCTQSNNFDFLLDLEGMPAFPAEGELYAPVFYSKDGAIKQGDTITIGSNHFTVAGFVRDSQMNSALAYSKRFIVNQAALKLHTEPPDFRQTGLPSHGRCFE